MNVIIDYGMGNLGSIINAFDRLNIEFKIVNDPEGINDPSKIILPGIGSFAQGIKNLDNLGFVEKLNELVLDEKVPILGICLGMQLFTSYSEEGNAEGLKWFDGKTIKFQINKDDYPHYKIPHMGWNNLRICNPSPILRGIDDSSVFYFVHSYHVSGIKNENILATTDYGGKFISVIRKDNIYGFQPHPERSHDSGLRILKNFMEI
ncbi:glutamine amidotransferase [Methanomicrobium sp. W14]|uniref:imidazole glycerol phosphate synthase subunit HisH n=1 Tax=Methanomicrobium sp. W14 TaxID=2817839 RepID=UPI001AEAF193|nr:imidazole glycerol phosphate synthase subunit HisH [Methanomicrobium sp. W14]MBP2133111.1 glutamine amidotransferase [Methanomicrobium sp. W14]